MTAAELIRELAYPLRTLTLAFAILFSWLLVAMALALIQLGSIFIIFGLTVLFLFTPVYFRYLLVILGARAEGRRVPVLSIDMVDPWNNFRLLAPLVLYGLGLVSLAVFFPGLAWPRYLYAGLIAILLPASLAILAITRSALESLNPLVIAKTVCACGPDYALVPGAVLALAAVASLLSAAVGTGLWVQLLANYGVMLLFTLTGAVLREKSLAADIDIGMPAANSAQVDNVALQKARQKVANHAYGMISRGNRAGGFAHIDQWLQTEVEPAAAAGWFFNEMLNWESTEAALFYAQPCLAALLSDAEDRRALKLISRCLYEDPRWKPAAADRAAALLLVARYDREDLRALLAD